MLASETWLAELGQQVGQARFAGAAVTSLPERVKSFAELGTPKAKAILQTILKAAYVWTDNQSGNRPDWCLAQVAPYSPKIDGQC